MPRPNADATKKLRGTDRADRSKEPTAAERLTKVPKPPAHLAEAAKTEWKRLAPVLVEAGTLTAADLRALELLASTLADAASFSAAISKDGLLISGAGGSMKAHPGLQALASARSQARALLLDFGLVPRARSIVEAAPEAPDGSADPLDEFA